MPKFYGSKKNGKDYEEEGVFYEKSDSYKNKSDDTQRVENYEEDFYRASSPKVKKKQIKSQFALFYILTLIAAVIVCITVFAIVFSSTRKGKSNDEQAVNTPLPSLEATEQSGLKQEARALTAIIKNIDKPTAEVTVIDVTDNIEYVLTLEGATSIKNKYGKEMVLAELNIGDILDASFDDADKLLAIKMSPDAWEYKLIKNAKVDDENKVIAIGNENYLYDENIVLTSEYAGIKMADISEIDLVTIKGYKNKALFVDINKSHGFIEVINKDKIKDGNIEIDTTIFVPVADNDKIEVTEGSHQFVVKGLNIEPFVKTIEVKQGQSTIVDLNESLLKSAVVKLKSNVEEYRVFVDDKEYLTSEPLVLDLGTYTFTAKKEGYLPFKQVVEVKEPEMTLDINLQEEVAMRKFKVVTSPEGAEIYIDNGFVGQSPVVEQLTDGKHTVTARKSGYVDSTITVDINKDANLNYKIVLQQLDSALPVVPEDANTLPPDVAQPTQQAQPTTFETKIE